MNTADHRRRTRWTALLLAAILVPTAVVILLVFRVVRQERELGERRASDARREAREQLRRELAARLQALRLEEVNRLIGESGTRLPPDSPIVFVAPMAHDSIVLPWEGRGASSRPSAEFLRYQGQGESLEFQRHDAAGAAASYLRAAAAARTLFERCTARLSLARGYLKAGMAMRAERTDRGTLADCSDVADVDGVPIAVYAAERLLDSERDHSLVTDYVVHAVNLRQWPSPNESYALRSLLHRIPRAVAAAPLQRLTLAIHDIEQVDALAHDLQAHPDRLQRAFRTAPGDLPWMGYGDEPWLVTLVSPTSFAAPVVMAVSSRRSIPAGVTLRASPAPAAVPLGDGFVDLYVQWAPGRFADQPATPAAVYGALLSVVLGAVLLAGYSVLSDVRRESDTALMRSNFVASVSHELKTPLTSIRAHAETLLMGRAGGAEATGDYLRTIVSESERLGRLAGAGLGLALALHTVEAHRGRVAVVSDAGRGSTFSICIPLQAEA